MLTVLLQVENRVKIELVFCFYFFRPDRGLNHDLKFSDDPADKTKPITVFDNESSAAYAAFYQDKFYLAPNEYLSCGKRFLLANVIPVDIVCLNSSYLQQLKHAFQGHGFIGDEQMNEEKREKLGLSSRRASSPSFAYDFPGHTGIELPVQCGSGCGSVVTLDC